MNTTMSLLFYLKKPKKYESGPVPVYLRITINGQRAELSTNRECNPDNWNSAGGKVKGTKDETRALNAHLDILKAKAYEAHQCIFNAGEVVTADSVKNKITGKGEKPRMLIQIFEDHNNKMEALIGDEFAPSTLGRYKTSLKHTIDFIKWKYNLSDIDIRKIDYSFVSDYEFYLRSVRKCQNNSAVKYIKNFGKIVRICIANGWLTTNPFVNYKAKVKQVDRIFLAEDELQTIAEKHFKTERLNQVRDVFLFSCYTGLAYADVKKLRKTEISTGIDGDKWIFTNRQKTEVRSSIPLLPIALQLIEKYKDHPQCVNEGRLLPVLSNQKMNSYLKEIADCCGIDKELTYHIARHTFATTVTLTNGVSIESVSKMLGHRNLKTTQHYAKILDKKVSDDMQQLRAKMASPIPVVKLSSVG